NAAAAVQGRGFLFKHPVNAAAPQESGLETVPDLLPPIPDLCLAHHPGASRRTGLSKPGWSARHSQEAVAGCAARPWSGPAVLASAFALVLRTGGGERPFRQAGRSFRTQPWDLGSPARAQSRQAPACTHPGGLAHSQKGPNDLAVAG